MNEFQTASSGGGSPRRAKLFFYADRFSARKVCIMLSASWFRRLTTGSPTRSRRPGSRRSLSRRSVLPLLEVMEVRCLLSTIVVNNPTDTPVVGEIDLRQAIVQANTNGGAETITFDKTVFKTPQTITLTGGQLELSDTTGTETITGPKAGVTVNAGGLSRVFQVDAGVTASISGMTITGGSVDYGTRRRWPGQHGGTTTLTNCTVSGNSAAFGGGGLYTNSPARPR